MTTQKAKKVSIDQTTFDFYIAETEQMHALCDRCGVPRVIEGTAMSTAQRVAILAGVHDGLLYRLGRDPVFTTH